MLTLLLVAAAAAGPACGGQHDFLVRSDPLLAPVRPPDCATTTQTPPEFTWPPQSGDNRYTVTLVFPDGHSERKAAPGNWLLWDRELPAGEYRWRVDVEGAVRDKGAERRFTIERGAVPFVVPSPEALLQHARKAPRPRVGKPQAEGFASMRREVDDKLPAPTQPEPSSGSEGANYEDTAAEFKRTVAVAIAWAETHDRRYGRDVVRRVLNQASWNPLGKTSYSASDMSNRTIAWGLALAYDLARDALSETERQVVLKAIATRTQPMFEDVIARQPVHPYDSHGNITLVTVAAIGALMAGELPQADRWVKEAAPLAVAWTSPWGWKDGGFGNGTAQMFWDTASLLPAWYVLREACGIDLAKKEWVRNHAAFMAYFAPPGAPAGAFGDGRELPPGEPAWRAATGLARFAPTPLGRWYAGAQKAHDEGRIELTLAPREAPGPKALPAGLPDDAFFPSIGWVAMHSRLADPDRTSVLFKSSPYGSYNHSHGDQNAFVIHHRGRRLAIASGFYDGYRTKHWNEWTKQTRSANAITFDGGQGQGFNGKEFAGEIAGFGTAPGLAWAVGHAERAYGGKLSEARRAIAFVKPSTIVVVDHLAAREPHAWEWNIHALERMKSDGDNSIELASGPVRACLTMLEAPEGSFAQTDRYTEPPQGKPPNGEWHGRFTADQPTREVDYVAVIQLDAACAKAPKARARHEGDAWIVEAGDRQLRFAGDAVTEGSGAQSARTRTSQAATGASAGSSNAPTW